MEYSGEKVKYSDSVKKLVRQLQQLSLLDQIAFRAAISAPEDQNVDADLVRYAYYDRRQDWIDSPPEVGQQQFTLRTIQDGVIDSTITFDFARLCRAIENGLVVETYFDPSRDEIVSKFDFVRGHDWDYCRVNTFIILDKGTENEVTYSVAQLADGILKANQQTLEPLYDVIKKRAAELVDGFCYLGQFKILQSFTQLMQELKIAHRLENGEWEVSKEDYEKLVNRPALIVRKQGPGFPKNRRKAEGPRPDQRFVERVDHWMPVAKGLVAEFKEYKNTIFVGADAYDWRLHRKGQAG